MKKATYKIEFEVEGDFEAGYCFSCPYLEEESFDYDDDGYYETETVYHCGLKFEQSECKLEIEEVGEIDERSE